MALSIKMKVVCSFSIILFILILKYQDQLMNGESEFDASMCFVDPRDLESKTRCQTSVSVISDITQECMHMTDRVLRDCKIPNVVHIVVIGGSFLFHHYLSLKSMHSRIKPDAMFVHGYDFPYNEPYFNQSIDEFQLIIVESRQVSKVFNRSVSFVEHKSDIIRLESLIRFGGIYLDLDVYALEDVDVLLQGKYDFVISPENDYGLNNGIMMSKRCASFPLLWYQVYKDFDRTLWAEFSIHRPKKLYDEIGSARNSKRVYVDKSLNSDYGSMVLFKNESDTPISFWQNTRLIHAFWRDHGIEYDNTSVRELKTNLGRMARELFE